MQTTARAATSAAQPRQRCCCCRLGTQALASTAAAAAAAGLLTRCSCCSLLVPRSRTRALRPANPLPRSNQCGGKVLCRHCEQEVDGGQAAGSSRPCIPQELQAV